MAYIVSPYAGAAEFPSDNLPAQLLSQGLQAGYARRMKEMENKMKLQEEGRKAFDEAYKYANLDLSKVDPIYHDELKRQADALAKGMIEAYKQNPASFKYNTAIADEARRLSTIKTQREAQSADIQKSMDARRQLEKEGKFDVAFNELGQAYSAWQNATDPAEKAKKQQEFIERYTSGDLNIATPKVEDYTPLEEIGAAIKKTVEDSQEKGETTIKQYQAGLPIIKQQLESNPKNISYYAPRYKVDPSDPMAIDKISIEMNKELNPARISKDEPRSNFYPTGSYYETKTVNVGAPITILPNRGQAESEWTQIKERLKTQHDNAIAKKGLNIEDYPWDENKAKDVYVNSFLKNRKDNTKFYSVEYKGTAENPIAPILDFNIEGATYRGRPQGVETDLSGNIKSFRIYEEPKYDKDGDLISGGNIINVKATPEGWSKYKTAYGLVDFEKREKLTPPSSGGKSAAEKPKSGVELSPAEMMKRRLNEIKNANK
jgi:hypothetical protein